VSARSHTLVLLQALTGAGLLLDPDPLLGRIGGAASTQQARGMARILGARQLLQAGLLARSGTTRSALRLAGAVDGAHAASMVGLAWRRPEHRLLALLSAGAGAGFCCWELSASRSAR
jgi:hypothetical protein